MATPLQPLNLRRWIEDNREALRPPVGNKAVVKGAHDRSLQKRFREAIIRPDMPPEDHTIG